MTVTHSFAFATPLSSTLRQSADALLHNVSDWTPPQMPSRASELKLQSGKPDLEAVASLLPLHFLFRQRVLVLVGEKYISRSGVIDTECFRCGNDLPTKPTDFDSLATSAT